MVSLMQSLLRFSDISEAHLTSAERHSESDEVDNNTFITRYNYQL